MDRERHLIEIVRRALPAAARYVRVGIGDDAAVLRLSARECVVTTDAFVEDVHFLRGAHPAHAVGFKALARAVSDIAAMGAAPRCFFMNLALPPATSERWLREFLRGMARACRDYGVTIAGGDTTTQDKIAINLTVLGETRLVKTGSGEAVDGPALGYVLRSGARPCDLLCVSGKLGAAELGLQIMLHNVHRRQRWRRFLRRHLYPESRVLLGQRLANKYKVTAMTDVSDGLSTDVSHLCEASGVGARIWTEKIPIVNIPHGLEKLKLHPLPMALHGGEDYELLFTVSRAAVRNLPRKIAGVPLTVIGEMTRQKKILLVDAAGKCSVLQERGWDPFRK